MSAPPIHESWKTDKTGKLVSMPWILWLQQLAAGRASSAETYPVGSLFFSDVSTNPNTLLGYGTWQLVMVTQLTQL